MFIAQHLGEQMQLQLVKQEATPSVETAAFEDFWTLYPRRVARKDAVRAWDRLTAVQKIEALVALVDWRRVWMVRGEMEFVPHAATWLNGERFYDDLPSDSTPTHASHVPAKPHDETPRGEMPQKVRDALAKLRGPR